MKKLLFPIGVLLLLTLTIINQVQIYGLRREVEVLHVEVKDAYARLDAQAKPSEHRFRFERSGASLWRYDETTGESCQVTSNQIDKWVGGHCPLTPEQQQQQDSAFIETLCKDNPNSDSCKALLKEKR
jgi:hypothetical protein